MFVFIGRHRKLCRQEYMKERRDGKRIIREEKTGHRRADEG